MSDIIWYINHFDALSKEHLYDILAIRQEVFIVEQNCPYNDADYTDQDAIHVYAYDKGRIIACARLLKPGVSFSEASIGRIITDKKYRGKGLGHKLVEKCIEESKKAYGDFGIRISGQVYAMDFYKKLGFKPEGEEYLEDGIPHMDLCIHPE